MPSGLIATSVITTRSVKDLKLAVGREVIALLKSTEARRLDRTVVCLVTALARNA
jgi:TOBE domain